MNQWGFGPILLNPTRKQTTMAIRPANKPYDPSKNKPGWTVTTEGVGRYRYTDRAPPKAGISIGLLTWVIAGASTTLATAVTLAYMYWP